MLFCARKMVRSNFLSCGGAAFLVWNMGWRQIYVLTAVSRSTDEDQRRLNVHSLSGYYSHQMFVGSWPRGCMGGSRELFCSWGAVSPSAGRAGHWPSDTCYGTCTCIGSLQITRQRHFQVFTGGRVISRLVGWPPRP